jgi:hypothetical protein
LSDDLVNGLEGKIPAMVEGAINTAYINPDENRNGCQRRRSPGVQRFLHEEGVHGFAAGLI